MNICVDFENKHLKENGTLIKGGARGLWVVVLNGGVLLSGGGGYY